MDFYGKRVSVKVDYFRFARRPPTIGGKRQGSFRLLTTGLLWVARQISVLPVAHLSALRPISDKRVTRKPEPSICGRTRRILLTSREGLRELAQNSLVLATSTK
jgi:hypothetical protein